MQLGPVDVLDAGEAGDVGEVVRVGWGCWGGGRSSGGLLVVKEVDGGLGVFHVFKQGK